MLQTEKQLINSEMAIVKSIFLSTINLIPSFNITDEKILPYGLKAHTRSVSWIAEQVITQQTKFNAKKLKITDVDINLPDTCLHDCIIEIEDKRYFVNLKMHNVDGRKNKNDISAVEKFFFQYDSNPSYRLICVRLGFKFENKTVCYDTNSIYTFSPQFLPFSVNRRNNKLRFSNNCKPIYRTRNEFLQGLIKNSGCIV